MNRCRRLRHESRIADWKPGDEAEQWSHDRLLAMDKRFCDRVERAIAAGHESPQGAAGLAKCARVTEIEMDCDQRA